MGGHRLLCCRSVWNIPPEGYVTALPRPVLSATGPPQQGGGLLWTGGLQACPRTCPEERHCHAVRSRAISSGPQLQGLGGFRRWTRAPQPLWGVR